MPRLTVFALALCVFQGELLASESTFRFGSNLSGTDGLSNASVISGNFEMTLAAGPAGTLLSETDADGLGINSRGIADVPDSGSASKFNLIDGTGPLAGQGEYVTFEFDRDGVIRDVLFDGVKDETLEFFTLEAANGDVWTFFDFEIGLRIDVNLITEPNVTLLTDGNDDLLDVNIPFSAGDQFVMTYGEFVAPGIDSGNGARWEGLVLVPEPAVGWLLGMCLLCAAKIRRRPEA